ncbi:hypothetical protein ACJX0J_020970, partial [Zea mays]
LVAVLLADGWIIYRNYIVTAGFQALHDSIFQTLLFSRDYSLLILCGSIDPEGFRLYFLHIKWGFNTRAASGVSGLYSIVGAVLNHMHIELGTEYDHGLHPEKHQGTVEMADTKLANLTVTKTVANNSKAVKKWAFSHFSYNYLYFNNNERIRSSFRNEHSFMLVQIHHQICGVHFFLEISLIKRFTQHIRMTRKLEYGLEID